MRDQLFEYDKVVLLFGLYWAIHVLEILKPVYMLNSEQIAFCYSYGITSMIIQMDQISDNSKQNAVVLLEQMIKLEYTVNHEKSVLYSVFGLILDKELFQVLLIEEKIQKLINLAKVLFI